MNINMRIVNGVVVIEPDDAMSPAFGDEIAEAISRLLDEGHLRFVISFARVETLDSAGLGALVRRRRWCSGEAARSGLREATGRQERPSPPRALMGIEDQGPLSMAHEDSGFQILPRVFRRSELAIVVDAIESAGVMRSKAGARHVLRVPAVRALAADARLTEIAAALLGGTAMPFRATLFDKSAGSNWLVVWHQDTALPLRRRLDAPGWGPWSVKAGVVYGHAPARALEQVIALRVHLDDSADSNGPLRVLPGSHTRGVLTDSQIAELHGEIEPVACLTHAGGVVAMRPLIVHASSKSLDGRPRRVLHIEYAASLEVAPDVELAVA